MRQPLVPALVVIALVIFLAEALTGAITRLCDPARSAAHYSHYADDSNWLLARVDQMPVRRTATWRVRVEIEQIGDSLRNTHSCKGQVYLYLPLDTAACDSAPVRQGDVLLVHCRLQEPSGADNPHQFDYRRHLLRKGICHTAFVRAGQYRIVGQRPALMANRIAQVRLRLMQTLKSSNLTPTQTSIAEALFLGYDSDLDPETQEQFRRAGITHLLCVSGLHVGIVAALVAGCLGFLGNRRRDRIVRAMAQLLAIWFFVALTGGVAGTVRAGLMFSFLVAGRMLYRHPPTLNTVAASALIMLVCKPVLLFDAGFQLSYAAVFGIVTLVPTIEKLIPFPTGCKGMKGLALRITKRVWQWLCVTCAAQLATTPLTLYYFHSFAPYFVLANLTIVPMAGVLLGSVIAMVATAWWPSLFGVAGKVVSAELALTELVTQKISQLPGSLAEHIWFDGWMLGMGLAAVAALAYALTRKRPVWLPVAMALVLATVVYGRCVEARCARQVDWTVYQVGRRTAVEFFAGHESWLLCDSKTAEHPERIDFQTENNRLWHQARKTHVLSFDSCYEDPYLLLRNGVAVFGAGGQSAVASPQLNIFP